MKYEKEFVNRVVGTVIEKRCSARQAERLLGVPRKTIGRWLSRLLGRLPYWFSRAAKQVRNRTRKSLLGRMRKFLSQGKSTVETWITLGKRVCLRTVQRWKAKMFPPVKTPLVKPKRYQRRKALSLAHTDWGAKRIKNGKRCCFTFWEDDATRRLYACRAYAKADQANTFDALRRARRTARFKAVLTDCGRVYSKQWTAKCVKLHVKPVHTRPYNPKCNGKAEAVVKKIKKFLRDYTVRDLAHANSLLKRFLRKYNNTPHGSLKYQTPLQAYRYKQSTGDISAVT
jgi:transposase InsO family protein